MLNVSDMPVVMIQSKFYQMQAQMMRKKSVRQYEQGDSEWGGKDEDGAVRRMFKPVAAYGLDVFRN